MTRREMLLQLAAAQHVHRTGDPQPAGFRALDAASAAELEALAAEIIPSAPDSPGAREAGIIHFIDRALETFDRGLRPAYRSGLAMAQAKRLDLYPQSKSIAGLDSAQRTGLLRAIEATAFFEQLREHTVIGFLANPEYGGNRGRVGWKLIGFDDAGRHEPPFGEYDRDDAQAR